MSHSNELSDEESLQARQQRKVDLRPKRPSLVRHQQEGVQVLPQGFLLQENPASKPNPVVIPEGGLSVLDKTAVQQEEPSSMDDGNFVIQLAALSDPEKALALRAKLYSIGISAHFFKIQILQGEVTRVRVGPFNTRDEAQAILHKLEKVGVNCMIVPN